MHCIEWLDRCFLPQAQARNTSGKPILLICDGHGSHCTDDLLLQAFKENVFVFRLPPHCTHKLQPLDVGILGPLQTAFANEVDRFVAEWAHGIGKADFITLYTRARSNSITSDLILKAWKHCGINPFNSDIFTANDFAPSQGYSTVAASHLPSTFPTLLGDMRDSDSDQEPARFESGDGPTGALCEFEDSQSNDGSVDSPSLQLRSRARGISSVNLTDQSSETESSIVDDSHSTEDLVHIIATLRAELTAKEEELQRARDDVENAKAHAILVGRLYTTIRNERNAKKSGQTGSLDPLARVLNTSDAIATIKENQRLEAENTFRTNLRLELMQLHDDRLDLWIDAAKAGKKRLARREREERQGTRAAMRAAEKAVKDAEKARLQAEAQSLKAAERVTREAEKAEREAAKARQQAEKKEAAAQKKAAKAAVTAEKKEVAAQKKMAAAQRNTEKTEAAARTKELKYLQGGKRRAPETSPDSIHKRQKGGDEIPSADKENTHRNTNDNSPQAASQPYSPLSSPARQNQSKPHPRPRYTGAASLEGTDDRESWLFNIANSSAMSSAAQEPAV